MVRLLSRLYLVWLCLPVGYGLICRALGDLACPRLVDRIFLVFSNYAPPGPDTLLPSPYGAGEPPLTLPVLPTHLSCPFVLPVVRW